MTVEKYEKELELSMKGLKKAWIRCLNIFSDFSSCDCNDYIIDNYPFDKSYDEINIIEWCDQVIQTIKDYQSVYGLDTTPILSNYYILGKKEIPIVNGISFPESNNFFDEEIIIEAPKNEVCIDNRMRLVIHKEQDNISIYSACFEENGGLCYWVFDLTNEEYNELGSINELIKNAFIDGKYQHRGISMATGKTKEELEKKSINTQEKENEYDFDI